MRLASNTHVHPNNNNNKKEGETGPFIRRTPSLNFTNALGIHCSLIHGAALLPLPLKGNFRSQPQICKVYTRHVDGGREPCTRSLIEKYTLHDDIEQRGHFPEDFFRTTLFVH